MKNEIDRTPTVSTIESYGTEMPTEHYRYYRERFICGISAPVFVCSVFIIIGSLILLGLLALVVFVILHHKL